MNEKDLVCQILKQQQTMLAETTLKHFYKLMPDYNKQTDPQIHAKSLQDINYHLMYLNEAITRQEKALFNDYVAWVKITLNSLGFSDPLILNSFIALKHALNEQLSENLHPIVNDYLDTAIQQYPAISTQSNSHLSHTIPLNHLAQAYMQALLQGNRYQASKLILEEVQKSNNVKNIYLEVLQPVQWEIGRLWQTRQISVAAEHYSTAVTQMIMSQLYPYIFSEHKKERGMVGACVGNELHEIGLRMVTDFFEMDQWNTYYLGANGTPSSIIQTLIERNANVLGISVTMTYHVPLVEELITAIHNHPECSSVKILVGGYPFNIAPNLWQAVQADGYAQNPQQAVELAENLLLQDQ